MSNHKVYGLDFLNYGYYDIYRDLILILTDMMISLTRKYPSEMAIYLAKQARSKRLSLNLSQQTLGDRSGVSYGVIKKFEHSGKISLESLLKIALVLDCLEVFEILFAPKKPEQALSLDELIETKPRQRGRR